MEKLQRFGGAMMPPVMLMPFAGIIIGLATIFMSQDIIGPLASDTTLWYKIWSMLYDGVYAIFNQLPLLFAVSLSLGLTN
ncbi:PTS transporter subunit EIIC [Collinsella intestinalis]|uniref:PTS transporter subunit EIIC n=1 Tax=Collinsella intestinalis TaxID=147207 RepID=UPI0019595C8B|nr:PTS transporter subunit EIIC [Collinsella intestinalis]MBM6941881.1 PTS transporter subunit EIIC [Collinsella intestinalis]